MLSGISAIRTIWISCSAGYNISYIYTREHSSGKRLLKAVPRIVHPAAASPISKPGDIDARIGRRDAATLSASLAESFIILVLAFEFAEIFMIVHNGV